MEMRLTAIVAVLALGLSVTAAQACTCSALTSVEEAFARADVVFLGTAGSPASINGTGPEISERTTFQILESWKGDVPSRIAVISSRNPRLPGCGLSSFEAGHRYLVYASADSDGRLRVQQRCSRTASASRAAEDLQLLERLRSRTE
jgi:hypothetical protein